PAGQYTDSDGKYTIAFPSKPKFEVIKGGAGVPVYTAIVQGKTGALTVGYYDAPAVIPTADGPLKKMGLGEARGIFVLGKGEMKSHKHVKFQKGHWAVEFAGVVTAVADIPLEVRGRSVLVGKRFYNVVAMGTPNFMKSEEAIKFLDSFEVTETTI